MKTLLIARLEQEQRTLTSRTGYDRRLAVSRCLALAIFAQETADPAIIDVPWRPCPDSPHHGPPFD